MKKIFVLFIMFFICPGFGNVTQNTPNACGSYDLMIADFELNSYNCASGYFLPANTLGCRACPAGYTCSGGTYYFNPALAQGLVRTQNNITQNLYNTCDVQFNLMIADFELNSYNCASGYFLPANTLGCRACPAGYTCSGGTYYFNPTLAQGLVRNQDNINYSQKNTCATNTAHIMVADFIPNNENIVNINWTDNNGSYASNCVYGDAISLPPTPTRVGYTFAGWKVNNNNE